MGPANANTVRQGVLLMCEQEQGTMRDHCIRENRRRLGMGPERKPGCRWQWFRAGSGPSVVSSHQSRGVPEDVMWRADGCEVQEKQENQFGDSCNNPGEMWEVWHWNDSGPGGEKWVDSVYTSKLELREFADGLNVGNKEMRGINFKVYIYIYTYYIYTHA